MKKMLLSLCLGLASFDLRGGLIDDLASSKERVREEAVKKLITKKTEALPLLKGLFQLNLQVAIDNLGAKSFRKREDATVLLINVGFMEKEKITEVSKTALDPEIKMRAKRVLSKMKSQVGFYSSDYFLSAAEVYFSIRQEGVLDDAFLKPLLESPQRMLRRKTIIPLFVKTLEKRPDRQEAYIKVLKSLNSADEFRALAEPMVLKLPHTISEVVADSFDKFPKEKAFIRDLLSKPQALEFVIGRFDSLMPQYYVPRDKSTRKELNKLLKALNSLSDLSAYKWEVFSFLRVGNELARQVADKLLLLHKDEAFIKYMRQVFEGEKEYSVDSLLEENFVVSEIQLRHLLKSYSLTSYSYALRLLGSNAGLYKDELLNLLKRPVSCEVTAQFISSGPQQESLWFSTQLKSWVKTKASASGPLPARQLCTLIENSLLQAADVKNWWWTELARADFREMEDSAAFIDIALKLKLSAEEWQRAFKVEGFGVILFEDVEQTAVCLNQFEAIEILQLVTEFDFGGQILMCPKIRQIISKDKGHYESFLKHFMSKAVELDSYAQLLTAGVFAERHNAVMLWKNWLESGSLEQKLKALAIYHYAGKMPDNIKGLILQLADNDKGSHLDLLLLFAYSSEQKKALFNDLLARCFDEDNSSDLDFLGTILSYIEPKDGLTPFLSQLLDTVNSLEEKYVLARTVLRLDPENIPALTLMQNNLSSREIGGDSWNYLSKINKLNANSDFVLLWLRTDFNKKPYYSFDHCPKLLEEFWPQYLAELQRGKALPFNLGAFINDQNPEFQRKYGKSLLSLLSSENIDAAITASDTLYQNTNLVKGNESLLLKALKTRRNLFVRTQIIYALGRVRYKSDSFKKTLHELITKKNLAAACQFALCQLEDDQTLRRTYFNDFMKNIRRLNTYGVEGADELLHLTGFDEAREAYFKEIVVEDIDNLYYYLQYITMQDSVSDQQKLYLQNSLLSLFTITEGYWSIEYFLHALKKHPQASLYDTLHKNIFCIGDLDMDGELYVEVLKLLKKRGHK